ncbi:hypothetical protein COCSUDRAFT_57946 [Coccomyxa subellipsoidea C-169]|uniref:Uncharacterized protein n=1 Tax=Coccomyxa subellipsoidea (strain C-169) TaxID=574566 RepID=I0YPA7_COCSC|nr:hypothetical protein COCSUDRAFT_57946 [Coccomyxa subellipsoidea C-169]EIE20226.1 hypothetical protein COCSUDRAFT_57946 [Coccomyxa subellipsoidea C-169]|eukprot:XP_005644770.1 hypothetical protein COCSUDRAFT_57946 [Coccomyxa subellipsoidea C-169]
MGEEAQSLQADIDKTTTKIEQLEAQLEALPSDATASDREYLQQRILALGREKELLLQLLLQRLLQRLPPAQGPDTPPRLLSRVGDHVGFSIFTLQHGSDSIEQELLIDTRCGLELLLQQSIADQLHLVPVPGCDIRVTGVVGL